MERISPDLLENNTLVKLLFKQSLEMPICVNLLLLAFIQEVELVTLGFQAKSLHLRGEK